MSNAKQCPSSVAKEPAEKPRRPRDRSAATGKAFWRSMDDLADTPEFREFLEREFPAHASELSDPSRRDFLRVMAASLALAGVAAAPGCRRPEHKIIPYNRKPEDVVHGKPTFYATAMPLSGGGAEGLLVETHAGRPTKIEGNPLHPGNNGRSSVQAQASILDLYDPDRLEPPSRRVNGDRRPEGWEQFEQFALEHFRKFDQSRGRGLAFLVEKAMSPSRDRMRDMVLDRWPEARWLPYEAIDNEHAREGARIAFGRPHREHLTLEKAKVILALERDVISGCTEGSALRDARGFGARRHVANPEDEMCRLYAVESMMTMTGGAADHRLRLKPSQVGAYLGALARAIMQKRGQSGTLASALAAFGSAGEELAIDPEWIDAVADDLIEHAGESVVVVGASLPPAAHALAAAVNQAIGAVGQTVSYIPLEGDAAASSLESIRTLAQRINAGAVDTLVVIGCNPVYDAPADLDFAAKYDSVPTTIHLGLHLDETADASTWRLNRSHFLENWGDVVDWDGTRSVVQPLIAPIGYAPGGVPPSRCDLELLAMLINSETRDPYEIVRATWRSALGPSGEAFEDQWRRILHDGLAPNASSPARRPSVDRGAVARAVGALDERDEASGLEVVFTPSFTMWDGRYANNGWRQELPDPITKITWDNVALLSPATAQRLGTIDGKHVAVTRGERTIEIPVFRQPGLPDDTVVLELGYGRRRSGRIGEGVGVDVYPLRTTGAMRRAMGVSVEAASGRTEIASVQDHWTLEGRDILREADLPAFAKHGGEPLETKDAYGRSRSLNFAARFGNESHTPANIDAYSGIITQQEHRYDERPQWGMSIDLNACSGCGACTIACQAENNIPVVGKTETLNGREMHWIRVDRYYGSADPEQEEGFSVDDLTTEAGPYTGGRTFADPDVLVMPVPCMHCENAPCETVCPVNATAHGREGLNEMAYNRCIGTRYCSNNCPYKVRRFNYFDYATKRLNGDTALPDWMEPENEQLVPPRLRERIDEGKGELQTLGYNPDVTVRERGVMEKCTFCIQRINESRVEMKLMDLENMPDGFVQTACQQACPTGAIVFGDILDPNSQVRKLRDSAVAYGVLDYLNTRPRTTYLMRLRNPNPRLRAPVIDPDALHHGGGHEDDHATEEHHDEGHVMSLPVLPTPARAAQTALRLGGSA